MPRYLLSHRHDPHHCAASVAAWRGFTSPLRGRPTVSSCAYGRHRVWWDVEAESAVAALALLPEFVAVRTDVVRVGEQVIP
jgi:hypothetical protein